MCHQFVAEYIPGAPATYSVAKSALNNYINIYSKYIVKYNYRLNGIVCSNIMFPGSYWEKKIEGKNYSFKKKDFRRCFSRSLCRAYGYI